MPFSVAQISLRASQDISRSSAASAGSELVEWAPDASAPLVEDMRIDHGRAHVAVPEQFLDGSDVVPGFEQMGRKAVSQRILTLPMNPLPRSFTTVTIPSTVNT